jgi:AcrR family transcriptional regulator
MARRPTRPTRPTRRTSRPSSSERPSAPSGEREKIIAALFGLLAEKPIEEIGLAEIANEAGVSLVQLRDSFSSPLAIVAAYFKDTDRAVLSGDLSDMEDESPRERLFDVLMRRLDAMAPHRQAIRSLQRSGRRSPPLALALNALTVRSQKWMLTAAGISASGPRGALRARGLALLFGSVLRTWTRDDDPGLARTMAALDRALGRGQRLSGFLDDLCFIPSRLCRLRSRWRRGPDDFEDEESVAA